MPDLSIIIKARNAASAALKQVTGDLGSLGVTATNVGAAMTAAGAAITAALGLAVNSAKQYGEQVDKISKTSGVSTGAIQRLGFAASQEHASMEALSGGLNRLSRAMASNNPAFQQLGITVLNSAGKLKSSEAVLLELSDRFQRLPEGPIKSALAMQIFGRSGAELVPFLSLGANEIRRLGDEAQRLGLVMTDSDVKAAEAFGDSLDRLMGGLKGLGIQIGAALIPVLNQIVDAITPIIKSIVGWIQANPGLTAAIVTVVGAVGALLAILGPIVVIIGSVVGALGTLGVTFGAGGLAIGGFAAAIIGLATPIGWVIAAIAAVAAAALLIAKFWTPIKETFVGIWLTIKEVWTNIVEFIRGAIDKIAGFIQGLADKAASIPGVAALGNLIAPGAGTALQMVGQARAATANAGPGAGFNYRVSGGPGGTVNATFSGPTGVINQVLRMQQEIERRRNMAGSR